MTPHQHTLLLFSFPFIFLPLFFFPKEQKLIALAGCRSDIEIIDAWSLKSTFTLHDHHDLKEKRKSTKDICIYVVKVLKQLNLSAPELPDVEVLSGGSNPVSPMPPYTPQSHGSPCACVNLDHHHRAIEKGIDYPIPLLVLHFGISILLVDLNSSHVFNKKI
jgi:hypothetical protein